MSKPGNKELLLLIASSQSHTCPRTTVAVVTRAAAENQVPSFISEEVMSLLKQSDVEDVSSVNDESDQIIDGTDSKNR